MSGWCTTGRHHRCYFTTDPDAVIAGYGLNDGHQWICACPCHDNQSFPICPHPDHAGQPSCRLPADTRTPVQINLF
jgi:hypothetical protein